MEVKIEKKKNNINNNVNSRDVIIYIYDLELSACVFVLNTYIQSNMKIIYVFVFFCFFECLFSYGKTNTQTKQKTEYF